MFKDNGCGDEAGAGSPPTSGDDDDAAMVSYTPEDKLVGIEKPKKDVLDLLQPQSEEQLKVVSIVGPRGLGKTDLARVVYKSQPRQQVQLPSLG